MIQMIRAQLELTQEELSGYLGVSAEMIRSAETGRRHLQIDKMVALAALYQTVMEANAGPATGDPMPPGKAQIQHMKRLYGKCLRRLARSTAKLEKMQKTYASACRCLRVYQRLAESQAGSDGDNVRLKWAELKIAEMMLNILDNNPVEQELLVVEIAGLKGTIHAMEGSELFRSAI